VVLVEAGRDRERERLVVFFADREEAGVDFLQPGLGEAVRVLGVVPLDSGLKVVASPTTAVRARAAMATVRFMV
jgi:hypothetical protein